MVAIRDPVATAPGSVFVLRRIRASSMAYLE